MKKLKSKFRALPAYCVLAILLLTLAGGFLLPLDNNAQALSIGPGTDCSGSRSPDVNSGMRVCNTSNVNISVDTYVPDPNGNLQKGNLVKITPTDTITLKVVITLNNPPDIKANPNGSGADEFYFPGVAKNPDILGFGVTITPQDTTNFCKNVNISVILGGSYQRCQSNVGTQTWQPSSLTTFTAGSPVYTDTLTISPDQFQYLGITKKRDINNPTGSPGLNQIFVYPDMKLSTTLSSDWATNFAGGAPLFVELYANSTDKQNDTSSNPPACVGQVNNGTSTPPSCVPGYGTITSSGGSTSAGGSDLIGLINRILGTLLGIIGEFIYFLFYNLLAPMMQAMLQIHTYTDTFVGVIYPAWIVVRNACNIMFIVAIIAIAMGTLFRVESYQYKHLLVQLIIAALLVNFSLVIGQAILGVADTAQNQFLPNNVDVIRSLGKNLMVQNMSQAWNFNISQGYFSTTVQQLFLLAMSIGSFLVFLAITVFLVIRMVMLWILLMVSPVAYVAGILPTTTQYRSMWWSNFIKYAFFTPIMAFLLNIAAYIANMQTNNGVLNYLKVDSTALGSSSFASFVFLSASNIILLVFLFAALMVADKLGVIGGNVAATWAKKACWRRLLARAGWANVGWVG